MSADRTEIPPALEIARLTAEPAALSYGPPGLTELCFHAIDDAGQRHSVRLGARALRQLASVIRQIDERFPGALHGH
jgi:hypothetical protein